MQQFSKWNKGYRYLLMVLDVFSKYGWIVPLKDKKGETVTQAFKTIFKEGRKPQYLWTDKGKEYYNKNMKELLEKNGITLYSTENEEKSSVCERWNRTIKTRMWKQFTAQAVAEEILKKRRQQGFTGRKDLLHLMMTANEETTLEGVSRLSDDEIVHQSIIFLLAGYETSSNTLSFTVYYLALNPDVQDKLRTEIKEAMESNAKKPLYDVVQNMEYLDCVIKESQRLCPPGAFPNRQCSEDYDLNGIHIPAGTEIMIPIYALHHDPDAWEDPEKFDPERFRGPAQDSRHAFQFLPFGAGPRNCIGMRFALMEIKITLVRILMKYKFVASPDTQVPLKLHAGATLSARDGVWVKVKTI
ncbi:hypothetical protein ACROYT_G026049 [Oculina patagonica]